MIRLISGISTSLRMRTLWKPSLKDSRPGGDDDDDGDGDDDLGGFTEEGGDGLET